MNLRYPATSTPDPRPHIPLTGVPLALLLVFLQAPVSAGCGGGSTVDDDASTSDASGIPDGDIDGGQDEDNDNDGYPASEDCDDNDDTIYPGTERDCQSDCDHGIQICLADGTWLDCTARTDCDCTTPGDTRLIDCGNCGQASQECGLDLLWGFPGDCFDEGECSPGEQGQVTCDYCGSGSRLCGEDCTWGPPDCHGTCTPGEQQIDQVGCTEPWEHRLSECNASCEMEVVSPCSGDCLLPARTGTADFKDEICVSGGSFVMGCDPGEGWYLDEQPEHIVSLSPYYIDLHEVTVARYRECVTAGACTTPDTGSTYDFPSGDALPVNEVSWFQAVDFCTWDGGRRLPTEAEWEKAARGPAPREVLNPWGDDPATCAHVPAADCQADPSNPVPSAVDAHPPDISYYGVLGMGGNVDEWVHDWYDFYYYSTSPSFDPQGPPSGTLRIIRGVNYSHDLSDHHDLVSFRARIHNPSYTGSVGFRCTRAAY
jgi:iron(II)-dependent oxidoreductase